jgi:hypothetical protein
MSPWKPLTTNDAIGCILSNASIRWKSSLDEYRVTGTIQMQHIPEVPGLFRLFIDGTTVIWNENGTKERGHLLKHCIYLPLDGANWNVWSGRKKSTNRPDYKAFVVAVQFPPNNDGISFLQVCVEVVDNDVSDGVRFVEALTYANTIRDRRIE